FIILDNRRSRFSGVRRIDTFGVVVGFRVPKLQRLANGHPMQTFEHSVTAFTTLFVAIGPIDTAIVFGALTAGVHRPARFRLAWQAVVVAGGVLLGFALFGLQLLAALHVSLDAFRFAGGVLLLLQAIQLIFGHSAGLSTLTAG